MQLVIWIIIPNMAGSTAVATKKMLGFIVFFQYLPRLFQIFTMTSKMLKNPRVLIETPWAVDVYNLLLYLLASHVVGACWYFLAVDRQVTCWKYNCQQETNILCTNAFFDCSSLDPGYTLAANRASWMNSSNITMNCDTISTPNPFFDFGIYVTAINKGITTSTIRFIDKYFYCAWIGLLSLR
jgi:cyclic nucleotide gated channel